MSLLALLMPKGKNGFGYSSTAEEVSDGVDLSGKTILVTGCNSGLGLETCRVLSLRGAHIVGLARTKEKAEQALASVAKGKFSSFACELSEPNSINSCVQEIRASNISLDVIIGNAGIMALPELELSHTYEKQFFTNHIGHFGLVNALLPQLKSDGRVILLSSSAHAMAPRAGIEFDNLKGEKSYGDWKAYGQSKLANLLMIRQLAKKFSGTQRTAFAVHPGVIATNLARNMNPIKRNIFRLTEPLFLKNVPQGAATQVYLAVTKDVGAPSGTFFADCNPAPTRHQSISDELAQKLWDQSEKIAAEVGLRV